MHHFVGCATGGWLYESPDGDLRVHPEYVGQVVCFDPPGEYVTGAGALPGTTRVQQASVPSMSGPTSANLPGPAPRTVLPGMGAPAQRVLRAPAPGSFAVRAPAAIAAPHPAPGWYGEPGPLPYGPGYFMPGPGPGYAPWMGSGEGGEEEELAMQEAACPEWMAEACDVLDQPDENGWDGGDVCGAWAGAGEFATGALCSGRISASWAARNAQSGASRAPASRAPATRAPATRAPATQAPAGGTAPTTGASRYSGAHAAQQGNDYGPGSSLGINPAAQQAQQSYPQQPYPQQGYACPYPQQPYPQQGYACPYPQQSYPQAPPGYACPPPGYACPPPGYGYPPPEYACPAYDCGAYDCGAGCYACCCDPGDEQYAAGALVMPWCVCNVTQQQKAEEQAAEAHHKALLARKHAAQAKPASAANRPAASAIQNAKHAALAAGYDASCYAQFMPGAAPPEPPPCCNYDCCAAYACCPQYAASGAVDDLEDLFGLERKVHVAEGTPYWHFSAHDVNAEGHSYPPDAHGADGSTAFDEDGQVILTTGDGHYSVVRFDDGSLIWVSVPWLASAKVGAAPQGLGAGIGGAIGAIGGTFFGSPEIGAPLGAALGGAIQGVACGQGGSHPAGASKQSPKSEKRSYKTAAKTVWLTGTFDPNRLFVPDAEQKDADADAVANLVDLANAELEKLEPGTSFDTRAKAGTPEGVAAAAKIKKRTDMCARAPRAAGFFDLPRYADLATDWTMHQAYCAADYLSDFVGGPGADGEDEERVMSGSGASKQYGPYQPSTVSGLLSQLPASGMSVSGENPYAIDTHSHGVTLQASWNGQYVTVSITGKNFYVSQGQVWDKLDGLMPAADA